MDEVCIALDDLSRSTGGDLYPTRCRLFLRHHETVERRILQSSPSLGPMGLLSDQGNQAEQWRVLPVARPLVEIAEKTPSPARTRPT